MSADADVRLYCVSQGATIREVVACIDLNRKGIALVTDDDMRLQTTIVDGDVRRAMLHGLDLDAPLTELLEHKKAAPPVTAPPETSRLELLRMMKEHYVRQIPLVSSGGRVEGLACQDDLLPEEALAAQGVVMAGGKGTRLHPLTEELPKPMLQVGDRPLLELTLSQLREAGIQRINITTHFKPEKIKAHFGNGEPFGVELNYIDEDSPLGTAGALRLIEAPREPLLVINGDILTRVDFRALIAYHQEHQAAITVGVRLYRMKIPYGVVESDGPRIVGVSEKPTHTFFVNAGIYLVEPDMCDLLPEDQHVDMPDLIASALEAGKTIVSFPIREYWLDIGERETYLQAQEDIAEGGRFHGTEP